MSVVVSQSVSSIPISTTFASAGRTGHETALVFRDGIQRASVDFASTEATDFASRTGLAPERLEGTFQIVSAEPDPEHGDEADVILALYVALRRQRMAGRSHYVTFTPKGGNLLSNRLRPWAIRDATSSEPTEVAVHGRIDEAMLRCFDALPEEHRDAVRGSGFVEEIRAAVMAGCARFVVNPFFEAARAGTLTQAQYIHSTANNHQFVRYTTRMLGLAVGACEDTGLRAHFAEHLSGEVNHEVWLEQDLEYLDADVDFVKQTMVSDAPILNFNFIQEAMTSFRRDPVVFMGVPIAIEGASAHMPAEAIEALRNCIRSWGYDKPKLGTRFLSSHIHTDGGHGDEHEGHWGGTLRVIESYVRTERQQQQILRIVSLVFDALNDAYAGYVAGPRL